MKNEKLEIEKSIAELSSALFRPFENLKSEYNRSQRLSTEIGESSNASQFPLAKPSFSVEDFDISTKEKVINEKEGIVEVEKSFSLTSTSKIDEFMTSVFDSEESVVACISSIERKEKIKTLETKRSNTSLTLKEMKENLKSLTIDSEESEALMEKIDLFESTLADIDQKICLAKTAQPNRESALSEYIQAKEHVNKIIPICGFKLISEVVDNDIAKSYEKKRKGIVALVIFVFLISISSFGYYVYEKRREERKRKYDEFVNKIRTDRFLNENIPELALLKFSNYTSKNEYLKELETIVSNNRYPVIRDKTTTLLESYSLFDVLINEDKSVRFTINEGFNAALRHYFQYDKISIGYNRYRIENSQIIESSKILSNGIEVKFPHSCDPDILFEFNVKVEYENIVINAPIGFNLNIYSRLIGEEAGFCTI